MKTKSFLRLEEYKHLARLTIDGAILDIGGSKKSGYHELIKGAHTITTGNIDASYGTDLIFDAQERWPAEDASFDGVLLINVLEHLYRYDVALDETARVLKRGGKVAGVVPFMFNVHGSPHDHFRYTRTTLERLLADRGFVEVRVEELGTGAFSVVYHALLGFVRWYWLARPLMALARGLDHLVLWAKPDNRMSAKYMPLGYYFEAKKSTV
jgi:SAM-dependent methyltransferase